MLIAAAIVDNSINLNTKTLNDIDFRLSFTNSNLDSISTKLTPVQSDNTKLDVTKLDKSALQYLVEQCVEVRTGQFKTSDIEKLNKRACLKEITGLNL